MEPRSSAVLPERTRQRLENGGSEITLLTAGALPSRIGHGPSRAHVTLHDATLGSALARLDLLALAEAYVAGRIDIDGDLLEVIRIGDHIRGTPAWFARLRLLARVRLPGAGRRRQRATTFHYDRPPDFFLPWLDRRWRSYSHGFYEHATDTLEAAQERKLGFVVDALELRAGSDVLDIGTGWGCFLEYAGRRGIRVHGLTTSGEQLGFVRTLIARERLPCTIELGDFLTARPSRQFAAVACLGCLEHMPDYGRVVRRLACWSAPDARFYADFCAQAKPLAFGRFLARHVWPGPTACVATGHLLAALRRGGFTLEDLVDDTPSYQYTVRDWADALERARDALAARFGEAAVRTFLIYLRASQHFFATRRTQAHHLVAARAST